MKLELRHLAPYLPYGLSLWHSYNKKSYPLVVHNGTVSMRGGFNINEVINDNDEIKPILRPLSDLTKEVEVNGKKFVPIEGIKESQRHLFFREDIENPLEGLQYSEIQKLFEWHFDVFGLTEAGLAIDINTLSE